MMNPRYQSQLSIPEIGIAGQEKLNKAKVFVVGAGGLGCPALLHLAGLGIGTIGIADLDRVSLSNLNRQLLYRESDIGLYKAEVAAIALRERNPELIINAHTVKLGAENAGALLNGYDLILDCSDNYEARYVIDAACRELSKPWIYAAVSGFEGQVTVFNHKLGYRFRDLFADKAIFQFSESCDALGIIGPTCAYASVLQIMEALKIILQLDEVQEGKLLCFNVLNQQQKVFRFHKQA